VLLSTGAFKSLNADLVEIDMTFKMTENYLLAALTSFTALIPAISMFLYKKRILQMRFNIFNSILLVVLQGFIVYYFIQGTGLMLSLQSVFPVISLILSVLAIRNILKDEIKIRSLNRIR
jgi:hypothetical protein